MKATQVQIVSPTARERVSAARPAIMIAVFLLLVCIGIAFLPRAGFDSTPVGVRNPLWDGARALAQVLERHGVSVREVNARQATTVDEDTTLVVVFPSRMSPSVRAGVSTRANVVYIGLEEEYGFSPSYLDGLTSSRAWKDPERTSPGCSSEAANRARSLTSSNYTVSNGASGWQLCFTADGQEYASAERSEPGRFRAVIPDSLRVRNRAILDEGNAALALNAIGRTDKVAWYVVTSDESMSQADPVLTESPYLAPAFLMVIGAVLLASLARGKRLGPLTPERLPVEVPAAETLIGKARLMRSQRSYAHAATALRSATASRIASTLGVAHSADREALVRAIEARGLPPSRYETLLWGPPPTSEADLVQLANDLDALEKEIRHD